MPNLETKQECKCHTGVSYWNLKRLLSAAVNSYIGHLERKSVGEPGPGIAGRAWREYWSRSRKYDLESLKWIRENLDSILR